MRKYAPYLTLALLQVLAVVLALLFHWVMRRDLLAAYATAGSGEAGALSMLPASARWALSGWLVPTGVTAGALLTVLGLVPRLRTRARMALLGTGLVVSVFTLAFAVAAAYAPFFG